MRILYFSLYILFSQVLFSQIQPPPSNLLELRELVIPELLNQYQVESEQELKQLQIPDNDYIKYKRKEEYWLQRLGWEGAFPAPNTLRESSVQWLNENGNLARSKRGRRGNTWSSIGPNFNHGSGYLGNGRVNVIVADPNNSTTLWLGSPAGGIWKSTDGGANWLAFGDDIPSIGVSDIVIDPNDSDIMYIATGDKDGGSFSALTGGFTMDTKGVGILKTTDGGLTWNTTGLSKTEINMFFIHRLLMDPSNSNKLIAATRDGIQVSTDAGNSWNTIVPGWYVDAEFHPTNPDLLYIATFGNRNGTGDTDIEVYDFTSNSIIHSHTYNNTRRAEIAVSADQPDLVNVLLVDNQRGMDRIISSTDNGENFSDKFTALNLLGYDTDGLDAGGQGTYDLAYAINPNNSDEQYVGGVNIWQTTDGGTNWNCVGHWAGQGGVQAVHADQHFFYYHPDIANTFYACNDGGVVRSSGSAAFTELSGNLQLGQIYRFSVTSDDSKFLLGHQDNSTIVMNGDGSYFDYLGTGDGMDQEIDPNNNNIMYTASYYGAIAKSTNGGANWSYITDGGVIDGSWVTPYVVDPNNSNKIIIAGNDEIHISTDQGANFVAQGLGGSLNGTLKHMDIAESNSNYVYFSTFNRMYRSTDGANSVTNITANIPDPTNGQIAYIKVDPTDEDHVFLSFAGFPRIGATTASVFESTDAGDNWTNISYNLPQLSANCTEFDPVTGNLYVGTDIGVFLLESGETQYEYLNDGLPNVPVSELIINSANTQLFAATFGRGVWQYPLTVPSVNIFTNAVSTSATNPLNWSLNLLPNDCNTDGIIASGATCEIPLDADLMFQSLTIEEGATLEYDGQYDENSSMIFICENLTNENTVAKTEGFDVNYKFEPSNPPAIISSTTPLQIGKLEVNGNVQFAAGTEVIVNRSVDLISGTLDVSNGSLVLNSGLLIHTDNGGSFYSMAFLDEFSTGFTGNLNGPITCIPYIPQAGDFAYYLGTPFTNYPLSSINGLTLFGQNNVAVTPTADCSETQLDPSSNYGNVFEFKEEGPYPNTCKWDAWYVRSTGNLSLGEGYALSLEAGSGNTPISMIGTPNYSDVILNGLTKSSGGIAETDGVHILSNPFAAPYLIQDLSASDFGNAVYIFRTSGPYQGTFDVEFSSDGNTILPPNQGAMFIRNSTGAGSFTFSESNRVSETRALRSGNNMPEIEFILTNSDGQKDKTRIRFAEAAGSNFDWQYDAFKIPHQNRPYMYTELLDTLYSVNSISNQYDYETIPLFIKSESMEPTTLQVNVSDLVPEDVLILIEDVLSGEFIQVSNEQIQLPASANSEPHPYIIHIGKTPDIRPESADCASNSDAFIQLNYSEFPIQTLIIITDTINNEVIWNSTVLENISIPITTSSDFIAQYYLPGEVDAFYSKPFSVYKELEEIDASTNLEQNQVIFQPFDFTITGVDIQEYSVNMGDGTLYTQQSDIQHTYQQTGEFTVIVEVKRSNCIEQLETQVNVQHPTNTKSNVFNQLELHTYSDGTVLIEIPQNINFKEEYNLSVLNMVGQATNYSLNQVKNGYQLRLPANSAKGVYLLVISNKESNMSLSSPVIK